MRRQSNSILPFYRKHMKQDTLLLSGHKTIDDNLKLYTETAVLFYSEPYAGATSLCLEYADVYTQTGLCLYVDCNDSVLPSRLGTIDTSNFIHIRPNGAVQLLDILHELSKNVNECLIILDGAYLLDGPSLSNTVISIRKFFPKATILATFRDFRTHSSIWSKVVHIENKENYYHNRIHLGHFVSLTTLNESAEHLLSYKSGRFSKVYDQMNQEVLAGKSKSDFFEFEGQKTKGFWNTLETVEQQKQS